MVPVNDSGTGLLYLLMEKTPLETERTLHIALCKMNQCIERVTDTTYPLTYNGERVFSGYTMDIHKIHDALEDHLNGLDFHICCFPDQVSWYRKLFPEKEFL